MARAHRERDWLMILVAYNHGLRVSEVLAITRDDVQGGFLRVQRLKGSKRTVQPLICHADPLLSEGPALIELARKTLRSRPLFNVSRVHAWRLMKRYAAIANVALHKATPHSLKSSCARQIIATEGVPATQEWLGHKSGKSTLEYTKLSAEEAAAAAKRALSGV